MTEYAQDTDVIIVGGGPAGLGAATYFADHGFHDWVLYERDRIGGAARSTYESGGLFPWDHGGHILYSHDEAFLKRMQMFCPMNTIERRAGALFEGAMYDYPVQQQTGPEATRPNMSGFLVANWGPSLAQRFMWAYNRKMWAHPIADMSADWVKERVAVPKNYDNKWGPNATFLYPKEGGIGSLWTAIAGELPEENMHYGLNGADVELKEDRSATLHGPSSRTDRRFKYAISTEPITVLRWTLAGDADEVPLDLSQNQIQVDWFLFHGEIDERFRDLNWVYVADKNIPFHRVTFCDTFYPGSKPQVHHIMTETSFSQHKPRPKSFALDVLEGLRNIGLKDLKLCMEYNDTRHAGYPIPTLGRDAVLAEAHARLRELGIWSVGRFGGWLYERGNMDHAWQDGQRAAKEILEAL